MSGFGTLFRMGGIMSELSGGIGINSRQTVLYSFIVVGWVLGKFSPIRFADYGIFVFFLAFCIPYLKRKKVFMILSVNLLLTYVLEFPQIFALKELLDMNFPDHPELFYTAFLYASIFVFCSVEFAYRQLRKKRVFERIGMIQ